MFGSVVAHGQRGMQQRFANIDADAQQISHHFTPMCGILSRMCAFVRRTYKERTQCGSAKYEYTDNDIAKSSWLLQGRAPKRRDSRLDRSWSNPDIDTEMPGLSGRICRAVDRNRAFALSCNATASVASDSVYRFASFSRRQARASFDPWRCRRRFQTG